MIDKIFPMVCLALLAGCAAQPSTAPAAAMPMTGARMQTMHEQMDRIYATQDPVERERLMQEHMRAMREMMAARAAQPEPGAPAAPQPAPEADHSAHH
jgi:hypothetical protein